jgi:hypothetical protein
MKRKKEGGMTVKIECKVNPGICDVQSLNPFFWKFSSNFNPENDVLGCFESGIFVH